MGYRKPLDSSEIKFQLIRAHGEICSPYNDGYISWNTKQELYQIKFLIDEMLRQQPTFSGEEEWLEEQHKKHMWSELKR